MGKGAVGQNSVKSGGLLCTRLWTFVFNKMRGIPW